MVLPGFRFTGRSVNVIHQMEEGNWEVNSSALVHMGAPSRTSALDDAFNPSIFYLMIFY